MDGSTPGFKHIPPNDPPRPTWTDLLGLSAVADRFEAAHNRYLRAQTVADAEAAEHERRDIAGEFWRAGSDRGELFLLLLRYAVRHQPEALAALLAQALRRELDQLADAVVALERGEAP
jgi:hypothetical protein